MKKAIIITAFDNYSYQTRVKYIESILNEKGYETLICSSDFDHRLKTKYDCKRKGLVLVHVLPYKKNISINRIISHTMFSKKVLHICEKENPDLIYAVIPPNFICYYIGKYRSQNIKCKLIYDVGDMWPETMPISNKFKSALYPLLNIWANIRNKGLNRADGIAFECNLFKDYLLKYIDNSDYKTIYLCKEDKLGFVPSLTCNSEILKIVYIGSINNIIDIKLIALFLEELHYSRKCELILIGDGEKKSELCNLCRKKEINIVDYGIVFDDKKKMSILKECHFGLNIMRQEVFVGATMKSLEYFYWGLAVINNIPADSYKIIESNNCGYNLSYDNIKDVANQIASISEEDIIEMKNNSRSVYSKYFSKEIMNSHFTNFFNTVIGTE